MPGGSNLSSKRRPAIRQARPRSEADRRRSWPILAAGAVVAVVAIGAIVMLSNGSTPPIARSTATASASVAPDGIAGVPRTSSPGVPSAGATGSPVIGATPSPTPSSAVGQGQAGRFGLGLLIADRGNGRLLIVDDAHRVLWRFPAKGSLPPGQRFSADDAFLAPDGRTIVANDEFHEVIDRIDIVTRKIVWQYGHYGVTGSAAGYLHTPDDAYPLANGDVTVADIRNCRILEINPAKQIVHMWGHTRQCAHHPPFSYDNPNGDTPLPDGGVLITEIGGSRVVRLDADGRVVFDIHVPVAYPSDAQLDPQGNVIVVDYSARGALVKVDPKGRVVWRYTPATSAGRLDHPSLAIPLPDGTIAVNDDFRHRVVVIDPTTNGIVWQQGRTDLPGTVPGDLNTPDGMCLIPLGTILR